MDARKPRATATRRKRTYDGSRRRAEADRTTERIVEAATALIKAGAQPEALSYAEVASGAGVTKRTVYRHFPDTAQLLAAVAASTLARFTDGAIALDRQTAIGQIARVHRGLAEDPALLKVFLVTPVRSAMNYGALIETWFADALERVPAQHRAALAATIESLTNPYAWDVMHNLWHLPPERITRTGLAAVQAVVDAFTRDPSQLDPAAPLPPLFRPPREPAAPPRERRARRRTPSR